MAASAFAKLSEVADLIQGGRHRLSGKNFVEDGFPAYGAGGLNGYLESYEFEGPGLVLGTVGTCGRCYFASDRWTSLANTRVILPNPDRVDIRFLWHQLNRPETWYLSGTAQPFIKPSDVSSRLVYLPPITEQRRIAAILDQADALRAKRRAALSQLDELARAVFVEMFGALTHDFRRWPMQPLTDLIVEGDNINYGVIQPGDEFDHGVPLVRVGDLVGGSVRHTELKRIDPAIEAAYRRSRLVGDEILVSCVGSIGVVAMATVREAGFNIARAVARVRVGQAVRREFVAAFLQTDHVQEYFRRELRTVSQPTLNIKQLGETMVPVPPKELQEQFVRRLGAAKIVTIRMQQSEADLDTLALALQHRAFRGDV